MEWRRLYPLQEDVRKFYVLIPAPSIPHLYSKFFMKMSHLFFLGRIQWRQVVWGVALQFIFGLLILRWNVGREIFSCLGHKVSKITGRQSYKIFLVFKKSKLSLKLLKGVLCQFKLYQLLYCPQGSQTLMSSRDRFFLKMVSRAA